MNPGDYRRDCPPCREQRGAKVTSTSTKLARIRDNYLDGVLGKEIFPDVTSIEHTNNPIAKVSDFFLRKATKTIDAICVLCEAGFPEDALVLGRTIFELSLHLKWIASPDLCRIVRSASVNLVRRRTFSNAADIASPPAQIAPFGKCLRSTARNFSASAMNPEG